MVEFIESKLVRLRKEVDEMWELVRTQIDKSGNAVQNLNREDAQTVIVREKHVNAFELKIDSDIEDIIALYSPEPGTNRRFCRRNSSVCNSLSRTVK